METTERKRMLYKSKVEYMSGEGVYAMNHALGCIHGCRYPCYAYLTAKRFGQVEGYEDWCEPKLVCNALELLKGELSADRREPIRRVHMCFTTDPFPYLGPGQETDGGVAAFERAEGFHHVSMMAIREINSRGIPVTILTKGTMPWLDGSCNLLRDFATSANVDNPHPGNEYGISLSSLDEGFRERWEPGAAPFAERIAGLRALHDAGCRTWVSVEPWPSPDIYASTFLRHGEDAAKAGAYGGGVGDALSWLRLFRTLEELLEELAFVDRIVFGRWNYGYAGEYDDYYRSCADKVRVFCARSGIKCVVKRGTGQAAAVRDAVGEAGR